MYEDMLYEAIRQDILEEVTLTDRREGSFVSDMVSPIAYALEKVYNQFDRILGIMFLDTSAGEYLDKRGAEYGIIRKEGTYAKGFCTFTGAKGTEITQGALVAAGRLLFETTEGGEIGEEGSLTLPIQAQGTGDAYNVLPAYINSLPADIFGVTAVSNGEKLLGGTARETDEGLAERILMHLQAPATSGNIYHYKMWALDVEGIGNARIFPLDNGPGTVTVLPITGEGRSPDEEIIEAAAAYIEEQRPIGATVTVLAPTEVFIHVKAKLRLTSAVTAEEIRTRYRKQLEEYIRGSVFRLNAVDFYKCLSLFYELEGVISVEEFTINDGGSSVSIGEKEIQVAGDVQIEGAAE